MEIEIEFDVTVNPLALLASGLGAVIVFLLMVKTLLFGIM